MTSRPRLTFVILFLTLLAPAGAATWLGLSLVFSATFEGVPDGPGNGVSFPAEVGDLLSYTSTGDPLPKVAPNSGIYSERLVLTDKGGDPTVDLGVAAIPSYPAYNGLLMSFKLRFDTWGTDFSVNVTDSSGMDISRVKFDGGDVNVNGKKVPGGKTEPNMDYRVDIHLAPKDNGKDLFVILLTDAATGRLVGSWTGAIPGGYRPVAGASFTKCGTAPGSVTLDSIRLQALD